MENAVERGPDWGSLPVIATVVRLSSHPRRNPGSDSKPRG
jgi:hypothetical protein